MGDHRKLNMRERVHAFLIDMDGVLYRGEERLPGARRFLRALEEKGVPYVLLTNNATRTPTQFAEKLARMDIDVPPKRILTSAVATARYLARVARPGTRVYAIGMEGLFRALEEQGFVITQQNPEYVVVGLDTAVTYEKLATATLAIRNGAAFIGTNPDRTLPTEKGLVPGAGALLAAVEAATDVAPKVIGKPEAEVYHTALEMLGTPPETTAMLGDRLDTDIAGAKRLNLLTILVLTGVTTREALANSSLQPDWVVENLDALLEMWDGS